MPGPDAADFGPVRHATAPGAHTATLRRGGAATVNAVADVPPGVYRQGAPRHAPTPLRKPAALRAAAQAAALDQLVIGGAAAVCVPAIDLARDWVVPFAACGVPVS